MSRSADGHEATRIDKSVLTLSTPRRYRNKEHLRYVAQQPCLLCARKPSNPHHLQFVQPRSSRELDLDGRHSPSRPEGQSTQS